MNSRRMRTTHPSPYGGLPDRYPPGQWPSPLDKDLPGQIPSWGVLVLLKLYWAPDIVEFVLGRFSHFYIAIAYSNSTFCGAWTPSSCEFTQNFSKTSTPLDTDSWIETPWHRPPPRQRSPGQRPSPWSETLLDTDPLEKPPGQRPS